MDKRLQKLEHWLVKELGFELKSLHPASADASFRRYFRAETDQGVYVVMDAPPKLEPIEGFISIARALFRQGVHSPTIYKDDVTNGFLLLEDLGTTTYLEALDNPLTTEPEDSADKLYAKAINALLKLQQGSISEPDYALPSYDAAKLALEMDLFEEWFVGKHLQQTLSQEQSRAWEATKHYLCQACLSQPQVWVHRDYHSRNLMVTEHDSPGVIDFQDMVKGPLGYDLASIFKDCYIQWPRADQHRWLEVYRQQAIEQLNLSFDLSELIRWVDLCGLQRHLKVLGIFCRLYYRDDKAHYLSDLPLVAKYVLEVLPLYPELEEFQTLFSDIIECALQAQP